MQVMKLAATLLPRQRRPRIAGLPVQMSIIRPLLKGAQRQRKVVRVAASQVAHQLVSLVPAAR